MFFFGFRVTSPYETDEQTDGRAELVLRPIGRPRNKGMHSMTDRDNTQAVHPQVTLAW